MPDVLPVRKRPATVQAMIWDGTPECATEIVNWILRNGGVATYRCNGEQCSRKAEDHHLLISTLEGAHRADPGYWIVRGVRGEFYGCRPDIAAETYEILDGASVD